MRRNPINGFEMEAEEYYQEVKCVFLYFLKCVLTLILLLSVCIWIAVKMKQHHDNRKIGPPPYYQRMIDAERMKRYDCEHPFLPPFTDEYYYRYGGPTNAPREI